MAECRRLFGYASDQSVVIWVVENVCYQVGYLNGLGLFEAAGGDGRGADADARGHERSFWVVRDCVFVNGNVGTRQQRVGRFPGETFWP